jgi:hypothetical protein
MKSIKTKTTRRRQMGRPPIPLEEARPNRVVTFVTNSEFAQLQGIAERKGVSLSATVQEILAGSLDQHP